MGPETLKPLDNNRKKMCLDIVLNHNIFSYTSRSSRTKTQLEKQYYIKVKIFHMVKEIIKEIKY